MTNPSKKRVLLYSLICFVISILAIEGGLHLGFLIYRFTFKEKSDKTLLVSHYKDKDWVRDLYAEASRVMQVHDFEPYLTWASKPFQGKYVNQDPQTGRKTWAPPAETAPSVFFLGGSAAWGVGARDDYTIPSHLARILSEHGFTCRVFNYGEPAYTFTQGLMHLMLLLREGCRPQYVICYDGFNDIYGAYQSGRGGTIHNLELTRRQLKIKPRQVFWEGVKKSCLTYDKVIRPLYQHFYPDPSLREGAAGYNDEQMRQLAEDVIQYYKKSVELLDHLARAYDFKYLCLWQPCIFTETQVENIPGKRDHRSDDRPLARLCRLTLDRLSHKSIPHFYLLTSALNHHTSYYIDHVHLSEDGNELMARKIYRVFDRELLTADRKK